MLCLFPGSNSEGHLPYQRKWYLDWGRSRDVEPISSFLITVLNVNGPQWFQLLGQSWKDIQSLFHRNLGSLKVYCSCSAGNIVLHVFPKFHRSNSLTFCYHGKTYLLGLQFHWLAFHFPIIFCLSLYPAAIFHKDHPSVTVQLRK